MPAPFGPASSDGRPPLHYPGRVDDPVAARLTRTPVSDTPAPDPDESPAEYAGRMRAHMEAAAAAGPVPRVEAFLAACPGLAGDDEALLDLIALERLLRAEAGESPAEAEFAARFPRLAGAIADLFLLDALTEEFVGAYESLSSVLTTPTGGGPTPPPVPARFRPARRLGVGGFGEAWLAYDAVLDRRVVLKFPRPDRLTPEYRARFAREARMAAAVRHENVGVLFDTIDQGQTPFLVLEYIDGVTLRDELRNGPLGVRRAAGVARDIARGAAACAAAGVAHRDINPNNVKIDTRGVVKLLDFGLARPLDGGDPLTTGGRLLGTLPYMAPEQLDPALGDAGEAADQFAVGVVLYEMLTGRRPFDVGEDPTGVRTALAIRECRPAAPRSLRPEIEPELERIALRMLRRLPGDRFPTLADAADALSAFLNGSTTVKESRRRPGRVAAAVGVLAALLVGALTLTPGRAPSPVVSVTPRPGTLTDLLTLVNDDLGNLDADDWPAQAYLTLNHLPEPTLAGRYADALTELLAALGAASAPPPLSVGPAGTALRVDLRKFGWSGDGARLELQRGDPYARQFPRDAAGPAVFNAGSHLEARVKPRGRDTEPYSALIRGDWLLSTLSDPARAAALLAWTEPTQEERNERLARLAARRPKWAGLLAAYDAPLDLEAARRELGADDAAAVRGAVLTLPDFGGEPHLGLLPLAQGGTVPRATWAFADVGYSTFGELSRRLKLGRRLLR